MQLFVLYLNQALNVNPISIFSKDTSASNVLFCIQRSFIVAIYSSYNYKHKILSRVPNCSQLCGYYRDYTYLTNLATTVFGTQPLSTNSDKELFCRDMFIQFMYTDTFLSSQFFVPLHI